MEDTTTTGEHVLPLCIKTRRTLLIRFYLWLWEADKNQMNTCKLFWGIVLAPFGLLLRFVIFPPFAWLENKVENRRRRRFDEELRQQREEREQTESDIAVEPTRSRMESLLEKVGHFFGRVWFRIGKTVTWFFFIACAVGLFVLGYLFIAAVIANPEILLTLLIMAGGIIGLAIGVLAFIAVAAAVGDRMGRRPKKKGPGMFRKAARGVHQNTCARIVIEE